MEVAPFYFGEERKKVMPFLVFLIILFIFPWIALMFLLFFALLIPLGFTVNSFLWIFLGPSQLFRIFFNRKVRRNHALEHGAINVLEERYGRLNIEGMAREDGFSVKGVLDPEEVLGATHNALSRLKAGERSLAVHRSCGTTIVVVNTIAALFFLLLLQLFGVFSLLGAAVALFGAHIIGQAASPWLQRHVTTAMDFDGLEIVGVDIRQEKMRAAGVVFLVPSSVFVQTKMRGDPLVVEVVSE